MEAPPKSPPVRRPRGSAASSAEAGASKRRICFQHKWLSKFALRITGVDADTSEVVALACRLCEKYGREKVTLDEDGAPKTKRRRTSNVKHFKPPWRSDNIAHHARDQHAQRFAAYSALTEKQKEAYLEFTGAPHETDSLVLQGATSDTNAFGGPDAGDLLDPSGALPSGGNGRVVGLIDGPIVDTILADVLLDADSEHAELVHDRAKVLGAFTRQASVSHRDDGSAYVYVVSVPNKLEFELCLQYMAAGASFRHCADMMQKAQEKAARGRLGIESSVTDVVRFARYATAMNFQVLSSILEATWAFSIILDGGNERQGSHVNARVRVALSDHRIVDFHVLALPIADRHPGRLFVYDTLAKLLTSLHEGWERKLVGIVSDGASSLTGRFNDVVAKLHQSTPSEGCYRVWSGAHQIQMAVETLFVQIFDDNFIQDLAVVTSHLRGQQELIAEMHCVCPRFVDTSWVAMGRLIDWFTAKRVAVKTYFDVKTPSCAPSAKWWVFMAALKRFIDIINSTLQKIQGLTMQLGQQREIIDAMITELVEVGYIRGPYENLFEAREFDLDEGHKFIFGAYYTTHRGAATLLEDLDPFVFELVEELKQRNTTGEYEGLVANVAYLYGESVHELSKIVVERSQTYEATTKLPSVLPHELVRLSGSDLNRLLRTHQQRLLVTYSKEETTLIHHEHAQLKTAYMRDASFKAQIDRMDSTWSFAKAWASIGDVYPRLLNFVAGLATVFPDAVTPMGTSEVLGCERGSDFRASLVDFSLESALQCKQYPALQAIAAQMGF
uniref:Uncharacterized protein n=1 Tax=Globisporangium ultimum (strain ATCC 200006 / CBS 805.95 / DAOM BR144) TaxID=431595 RepID=K3WST4_GLOUD